MTRSCVPKVQNKKFGTHFVSQKLENQYLGHILYQKVTQRAEEPVVDTMTPYGASVEGGLKQFAYQVKMLLCPKISI